jgi:hypothetical protein
MRRSTALVSADGTRVPYLDVMEEGTRAVRCATSLLE